MHTAGFSITILITTVAAGCYSPLGSCERKVTSGSSTQYSCITYDEGEDPECEDSHEAFSAGKTCEDLGYDDEYSAVSSTPGANGAFASGGGTGGSTSCSLADYAGPEFDIQIDSQCKAAYAYECSGNPDGVAGACAIYAQWKQMTPSIPPCPYCN